MLVVAVVVAVLVWVVVAVLPVSVVAVVAVVSGKNRYITTRNSIGGDGIISGCGSGCCRLIY